MYVFELGDDVQQLAVNELATEKELFWGSPAVSDDRMILRSTKHLYCIADSDGMIDPVITTISETNSGASEDNSPPQRNNFQSDRDQRPLRPTQE